MYLAVMTAVILLMLGMLIFLCTRFHRFGPVQALHRNHRFLSWLAAAFPLLILAGYGIYDIVNCAIILIHLVVFWIMADMIGLVIRHFYTGSSWNHHRCHYPEGVLALVATTVYLTVGVFFCYHVVETDYTLSTKKDLGRHALRIAQISDSHLGNTLDGEAFAENMKKVQAAEPDLVVITGDYVDDGSKKADMIRASAALGELDVPLGVWWVFGNHDKGYYAGMDFTTDELLQELEKNNVHVLQDERVMLTDRICLIGRLDRSFPQRMDMAELTDGLDPDIYTVVLDHQPHDFAAQAQAGVDLVLCGHTHGGQMFPIGLTGKWSGANDKTYGLEQRDSTSFIVSSGISDWAIKFKTAAIAEYVVIDIVAEQTDLSASRS